MSEEILYSETDESDAEKSKSSPTEKPPSDTIKKFGSLKKFTSRKNSDSSQSGSTSLDRKWFFNKSNHAKSSVPIPTAQFRSYRKIPASVSTGNFTSHIPNFGSSYEIQQSVPNLTLDQPKTPDIEPLSKKITTTLNKSSNFVHSSNPSICNNNDFALVLSKPKRQHNENLTGFVTLTELMNRQSEEQKLNLHFQEENIQAVNLNLIRPDVVYGVVPIRPNKEEKKTRHNRTSSDVTQKDSGESSCFGKRSGSMKKHTDSNKGSTLPKSKICDEKYNRSLPRCQNLEDSYWEKVETCKSLSDLEERSYEMIYCPETVNDVQFAQNRSLDNNKMYQDNQKKSTKLVKQHSLTSADKKNICLDSFKRLDKVADKNSTKLKLKSATQYTPMSVHVDKNNKKKFTTRPAFELSLDEKFTKSHKFKNLFSRQSEQKKEKSVLGSPKFNKAAFQNESSDNDNDWSSDINKVSSFVSFWSITLHVFNCFQLLLSSVSAFFLVYLCVCF